MRVVSVADAGGFSRLRVSDLAYLSNSAGRIRKRAGTFCELLGSRHSWIRTNKVRHLEFLA